MKKLSFLAIACAAVIFAACGNKQKAENASEAESEKSFEQEQIEASIKMHMDSIAAEITRLGQFPFLAEGENGLTLTKEEKQVKPDYLLDATAADQTATLAEKYRMLSALSVDKKVAVLYEMPTADYEKAIAKLAADVNDPSFKVLDDASNIFETSQTLYDAMEENGRINYFWQLASAALVEQLYVMSQNTDKFLGVFDDQAATNVTFRIIVILDAVNRLAQYDPETQPLAEALAPLEVLDATSVDQLKTQLVTAQKDINNARTVLFK